MASSDESRRRFLKGAACACCGATLAGCLSGNGDEDDGNGDGNGNGNDSSQGDYPEFDPLDPEFPQLTSTLMEHSFETGALEELDNFEERDEPVYGSPPRETPDDESEWIDPDTLDFAMVPTEDPTVFEGVLDPLLENIAEETGKEVVNNPLQSYAAQIETMRNERLHVAGFSTGSTPFAVNNSGAVPFSIQVGEEEFGYRLWVITQADNDEITELDDLAGKSVAHTSQSSNSGHLAPNALFTDAGVTPGEDYEIEFSGSHENSAAGIYHGDYDVAPICSTCYARVAERGDVEASEIKCIWASAPFPTTSFCYRYNLHPDIQEGIERAFLEYDYQDTEIAEEFEGRGTWVEIDYATHYHDILVNHQVNGVDYEEDEA
ncbi:phosphate/phosphite/phosphonate ABC transporter substrate-binding protein [Saliphagus sp. GCM10025308]